MVSIVFAFSLRCGEMQQNPFRVMEKDRIFVCESKTLRPAPARLIFNPYRFYFGRVPLATPNSPILALLVHRQVDFGRGLRSGGIALIVMLGLMPFLIFLFAVTVGINH
jgi:hypothetical protein